MHRLQLVMNISLITGFFNCRYFFSHERHFGYNFSIDNQSQEMEFVLCIRLLTNGKEGSTVPMLIFPKRVADKI